MQTPGLKYPLTIDAQLSGGRCMSLYCVSCDARWAEILGCRAVTTRRSGPRVDEDYEVSESVGSSRLQVLRGPSESA